MRNFHTDGPETERLSYYSKIAPNARRLQRLVYDAIRAVYPEGLNGFEAIRRTGLLDYTCRPRMTEMLEMGLLVRYGRRENARGNKEQVLRVANPAHEYDDAISTYIEREKLNGNARRQSESEGEARPEEANC